MNRFFLVVMLLLLVPQIYAQNLKGKVVNEESGLALADVILYLHELNLSVVSDENGDFIFESVRNGNYHLHISCIGFAGQSMDIKVPLDSALLIKLKPTLLELSEAVIEDSFLKTGEKENSLSIVQMGSEELEDKGLTSLSEALNTLPGVRSISVGSGIAKPVIRGVSGNRVLVNQQGIKQEGQQWGNDHGLEIDPNGVDRLELVKGPGSLWYGSDGLGGVINILSSPIPEKQSWNAKLKSFVRSNDNSIGLAASGGIRNEKFFLLANASMRDYGDYRVPADTFIYITRILPIHNERLKNTAGKDLGASLELGSLGDKGYVRLKASHFEQKAGLFPGIFGIPSLQSLADDGNSRNVSSPAQEVSHDKITLNVNRSLEGAWIEADAAVQHNRRKELVNGVEGLVSSLDLSLWSYIFNSRIHLYNKANSVIGFSGSYLDNNSGGLEFLIPAYDSYNIGLFYTASYKSKNYAVWNYGLRVDLGSLNSQGYSIELLDGSGEIISIDERSPDFDKQFMNVSGAIGWSKDLSEKLHTKLNLGKSFRIPNAAELGSNGVHHGTFRHEKGDQTLVAEHGYQLDAALYFQERKVLFRLTPYFNYFDGFIYLRPSGQFSDLPEAGQIYEYTQHDAIYTGYEFISDFHPREELHLELASEYVYAYNLITGISLPFTPPMRNRMSLSWEEEMKYSLLGVGADLIYVNAQNRVDRNEEETPGYFLINAHLKYNLSKGNTGVQVIFQVQNILDQKYLDHLSRYRQLNLPAQGRNINVQLIIPIQGKLKSKQNEDQ